MPKFELFRKFPAKWALWWVLVPNLAIIAMWPIGGPGMSSEILVAGVAALLASQSRFLWVRILTVIAMTAYLLSSYVAKSFNISLQNAGRIDQYLVELDVTRSPEYLVGVVVVIVSLALAMYFGSKTPKFKGRDQFLMAFVAVALLINVDTLATAGTRGSYKATAPAGEPIDSAFLQAGLNTKSLKAKNLVVIIVESWGVASDPYDAALDRAIWDATKLSARYSASRGVTKYFGSTTNAEVREWCAEWADHNTYDFDHPRCLPTEFVKNGFETFAFHSFNDEFFNRAEWYPKIGFQHQYFEDELIDSGARFCDGVFAGACDTDVPKLIGDTLRSSKSERNLVYWLTLNAHLPVDINKDLGTDPCDLGTAEWREAFPMLCRSYKVHQNVADAIYAEIMRDDFPQSDVLIVGDHMPPFFPRNIRTRFDAEHVPWLYLKNKPASDDAADAAEALAISAP